MQTSVQKPKSVRFGSGILYVSQDDGVTWINLGGLKDATLTATPSIIEVVLDNARLPAKHKREEVLFSANIYEVALDNLQIIDGVATYSSTDDTPVSITGEALGTGWTVDTPIKLANKNGDDTEVASIIIDADATPLVLDTDYRVYVWTDGFTYIYPLTAQTGVLDADYTYTPLALKQQVYRDIIQTLSTNRFKFENTDEDGKIFGIEFYSGYNRAGLTAVFLPDDTTDDAMNIPIEIKAEEIPVTNNLFRIYDQQDLS